MHKIDFLKLSIPLIAVIGLLSGCESITDTNQTFAIHTGSVSGDPCLLNDCSAECDKYKNYIVEAPGSARMPGQF